MTDAEVNELIKEVDQNDDGLIDYKEFLEMMKAKKKWTTQQNILIFRIILSHLISILKV